jgi:hypothetical protein
VTDVFEEVEENLRLEQYSNFIRKYGLWLAIGLVLLLGGVFGWTQYQAWKEREAGVYAQKLDEGEQLLSKQDYAGAEKYFTEMAKSGPANYRATAMTLAGAALMYQGDLKAAQARMEEAAKTATDPVIRDAAALKGAYLAADNEDYAALKPKLQPLIDGGGPFAYEARELLGAEAREAGDLAEARTQFDFLSLALDAPEGVRNRARAALAVMGPPEETKTPAAPAPAPAKSGETK